jgi:hypothetical protein
MRVLETAGRWGGSGMQVAVFIVGLLLQLNDVTSNNDAAV